MNNPIHLLCVDDDSEFVSYLYYLARPFNIIIENCSTIKAANDLISKKEYDAYFISVSLNEGSGFDLLHFIREEKKIDKPIIIITGINQNTESFSWLKGQFSIYYLIKKPIDSTVLQSILNELCRSKIGSADNPYKDFVDNEYNPWLFSHKRLSLYVVSGDRAFLDLIEKRKNEHLVDIVTEYSPEMGLQKIGDPSFNPRLIIFDESFKGSPINGNDFINAFWEKKSLLSTQFGMFTDTENLDTRLDAMNQGISFLFHKPISVDVFLIKIKEILDPEFVLKFKTVVITEDDATANFISSSLAEIGMGVKVVEDESTLFKSLNDYSPDCILLDLDLTRFGSLEILKLIRSDNRYHDIMTVLLASSQNENLKELAFEMDVKDILTKPLSKSLLQKRLLHFSQVHPKKQAIEIQTGLHSSLGFYAYIDKILSLRKELPFVALAEFSIYHSNSLLSEIPLSDDIETSFANAVLRDSKDWIYAAHIDKNTFALVMEPAPLKEIEDRFHKIITQVSSINDDKVKLNVALLPLNSSFSDFKGIIKSLKATLLESKKKNQIPLSLTVDKSQASNFPFKREVMIIDSDVDFSNILTNALKNSGYEVSHFVTGKGALDELFVNRNQKKFPSLILSERYLSDTEGLDLLRVLNNKISNRPPFFFISAYSSHKDIEEGMAAGADDYITKPFNLSILMRKISSAFE